MAKKKAVKKVCIPEVEEYFYGSPEVDMTKSSLWYQKDGGILRMYLPAELMGEKEAITWMDLVGGKWNESEQSSMEELAAFDEEKGRGVMQFLCYMGGEA